jgi:cytochrome c
MKRVKMMILLSAAGAALAAGPAAADGDAVKGEKVFKRCVVCHAVGEDAKNKVGPVLNGIIDQEIASVEGFKYSDAFLAKKQEGMVWTVEVLDEYLKKPAAYIKGTNMAFPGLPKEDDREDVIAYLKTFE